MIYRYQFTPFEKVKKTDIRKWCVKHISKEDVRWWFSSGYSELFFDITIELTDNEDYLISSFLLKWK